MTPWPGRLHIDGEHPLVGAPVWKSLPHRLCLEKSCPLIGKTHFRFDVSKSLRSNGEKLTRYGCWRRRRRRRKRKRRRRRRKERKRKRIERKKDKESKLSKEQRCGMTTDSVWKYNKSQLWIIGFLQLFHISGVYIRVVSSTVFGNSWITGLILTRRQLWGQAERTCGRSEPTWTLLSLATPTEPRAPGSPSSPPGGLWGQAEYLSQVWRDHPAIVTSPQYSDLTRSARILRHISQ